MNRIDKELESFKSTITELVKKGFEETGEVSPVLFALVYKEGNFGIAILGGLEKFFVSEEGKEAASLLMKKFNQETKPLATAFASEGWMSVIQESEKKTIGEVQPSKDPNRKEVVNINFETHNKQAFQCWEIHRDKESASLIESPFVESSDWVNRGDHIQGRFSGLLKENYDTVYNLIRDINPN